MNLDSLSFTLSQISYLVANLSKKNFEDSCREISGVSIALPNGWMDLLTFHLFKFIFLEFTLLPLSPLPSSPSSEIIYLVHALLHFSHFAVSFLRSF